MTELLDKYVPAYSNLARMNIHSLERGLAFRRMVIAKMQEPPDDEGYKARYETFTKKGHEIDEEATSARNLINSIIQDVNTPSDNASLARIENRIDNLVRDAGRHLNAETNATIAYLDNRNWEKLEKPRANRPASRRV